MPVNFTPRTLSPLSNNRITTDIRRRKLVAGVIAGKSLKQAGIDAGYAPKYADSQASAALKNPLVVETYRQILAKKGLSDEFLAEKGFSLINAKHTLFFQKDGIVTDSRNVDAIETQRKTWETVNKIVGHLKDRSEVDVKVGIMAVVLDALQSGNDV